MTRKELLIEYLRKFRLECHYRLDMAPADFADLPFYIYNGAHKAAKNEMLVEHSLGEEYSISLDNVYEFFKKTITEEDNYSAADNLTIEAIEKEAL